MLSSLAWLFACSSSTVFGGGTASIDLTAELPFPTASGEAHGSTADRLELYPACDRLEEGETVGQVRHFERTGELDLVELTLCFEPTLLQIDPPAEDTLFALFMSCYVEGFPSSQSGEVQCWFRPFDLLRRTPAPSTGLWTGDLVEITHGQATFETETQGTLSIQGQKGGRMADGEWTEGYYDLHVSWAFDPTVYTDTDRALHIGRN